MWATCFTSDSTLSLHVQYHLQPVFGRCRLFSSWHCRRPHYLGLEPAAADRNIVSPTTSSQERYEDACMVTKMPMSCRAVACNTNSSVPCPAVVQATLQLSTQRTHNVCNLWHATGRDPMSKDTETHMQQTVHAPACLNSRSSSATIMISANSHSSSSSSNTKAAAAAAAEHVNTQQSPGRRACSMQRGHDLLTGMVWYLTWFALFA